jgi:hypothetical protein
VIGQVYWRRLVVYFGVVSVLIIASACIELAVGRDAGLKFFISAFLLPIYVYLAVSWSHYLTARAWYRSLAKTGYFFGIAGFNIAMISMDLVLLGSPLWPDGRSPWPITVALVLGMILAFAGIALLFLARLVNELHRVWLWIS